jgi:hypothetical protein
VREYIILLRRMNRYPAIADERMLEPQAIIDVANSAGIQVLDIFHSGGIFDAVLVLRARCNSDIFRLLNALKGWHTEALLATLHARYKVEAVVTIPFAEH